MASRSVYEIEDVVATFLYALQTQQQLLAIQAARELRVSQEDELLINVVIMSWLLCDPYKCPITYTPTIETVYDCICNILDSFPSELPQSKSQIPVAMPVGETEQEVQNIIEKTVYACFRKKYPKQCIRIMSMLLRKHPHICYNIFETYGISKTLLQLFDRIVYLPLAERLVQHLVIQIMFGGGSGGANTKSSSAKHKYEHVWNSESKGRAARTFSIPMQALLQWNLKPKSATRIQNALIPAAIQTDVAAIYWQSAGLPTEETMEDWYTEHFPDDIPDEWSREEIEKSHMLVAATAAAAGEIDPNPKIKNEWVSAFLLCWS